MDENFITNISRDLKKEVEVIVQQILIQSGVKKESGLVKTVELRDNSRTNSFYVWVNNYYEYVSKGRKVKEKKVPLYALINWLKRYNIKAKSNKVSVNQLAFAIQNSIFKNGIKGKGFIQKVENSVTDAVEVKVLENFEELVADSIVKALQFNGKVITSK